MRKRAPSPRRVKKHRSYTVEEAARLFGCHRNTIRHWQKQGLKPVDGNRPVVFEGLTLAAFLEARRGARRRRLKPGEIYCLPCRAPKEPAGDMAEYVPLTDARGNLRGICPTCGRLIHRVASRTQIEAVRGKLEVTFTEPSARIREMSRPFVDCDFKSDGDT
jgi:MerR HTH family regulatory protein